MGYVTVALIRTTTLLFALPRVWLPSSSVIPFSRVVLLLDNLCPSFFFFFLLAIVLGMLGFGLHTCSNSTMSCAPPLLIVSLLFCTTSLGCIVAGTIHYATNRVS